MGRNKSNIILLCVLAIAFILLLGIRIYGRLKSNNSLSNVKNIVVDKDTSSKRRIANPAASKEQENLKEDENSKDQVVSSSIQLKSSNSYDITEENAKEKINDLKSLRIKAVGDIVLGRG